MTMSGLSYLTSLYLWWWLASLATGLLVGWRSVMPERSRAWIIWILAFAIGLAAALSGQAPGRQGLWLDSALLIGFSYFIGCCIGAVFRRIVAPPAIILADAETSEDALASINALTVQPDFSAFQFQCQKTHGRLVLTGFVPSEAAKGRLIASARAMLPGIDIAEHLEIRAPAPPAFDSMLGALFGQMSKLQSGVATLVANHYTLTGCAASAALREEVLRSTSALPIDFHLERVEISVEKGVGPELVGGAYDRPVAPA
jgi:hypothetical protein